VRVGKVVVITQYWGEGFFHTMIEGMPRLAQAMHDYPHFFAGNDVDVHVSVGAALGKVNDILRIIGFMRPAVQGEMWAAQLLLAPPTPCGGHVTGRHSVRLRALFMPFLVPQTAKLLISKRRHGSSRSITNHEALMLAVHNSVRDVKEHTGHEPLLTQMQMFAGAHVVMGPHGSGLANIIAMPEGKHVFEFLFVHGAEKPNYCYATLALSLGLHYWSYYEPKAEWASPWAVDIDKVMVILQSILAV
jgi:capsular polysaccharide biosynthesis protein